MECTVCDRKFDLERAKNNVWGGEEKGLPKNFRTKSLMEQKNGGCVFKKVAWLRFLFLCRRDAKELENSDVVGRRQA